MRKERVGKGGSEVGHALTDALDASVAALAQQIAGPDIALVAVGGYGRRELSPFSDVDLMILHEVDDPSGAAAAVFRPLWDAGLKLGHAVRTVREAARAARDNFETQTTLLTARLVVGDDDLLSRLVEEVMAVTRARPLRRHLVEAERGRRRLSPYLLMATDVKAGRGGLRTLQGFEWERRREDLIGRFSPPLEPGEAEARETLLSVRNALHAVAGRSHDVFSYDLRQPVARWLEAELYEVAERLVAALQTVDRLADRRWPEVVSNRETPGRQVWRRLRGDGGATPTLTVPSASQLADILRAGEEGRMTLRTLEEAGHLASVFPEWEAVQMVPQLAPFHDHPLEGHLWRTVDEMMRLVDGDDQHYKGIASEVGDPDLLVFAAFLHDIGKGQGGDHAIVGAGIAAALCQRLGLSPESTSLLTDAVRHHLLLSDSATRRDLDDPAVVADVAKTVGSLRLLQVLYLLTVADSRATGPSMWSEWKATLVRTLFVRCAAHFGAERSRVSPGATRDEVVNRAGARRQEAAAHIDWMPDAYLRSTPADEVMWHLDLIAAAGAGANVGVRAGDAAETAAVVGRSRPGFRRMVAQAFAANGIDVLEARLVSRADGMVVDTFRVRDDRTAGAVPSDRWDRVRADVRAALSGELDAGSKLAARVEAYSAVAAPGVGVKATISIDDATGDGVIVLKCSDRIGRLAEILTVLRQCGLEIRLAKLDSRGGEVVDTFHVRGDDLPDDRAALQDLAIRIESLMTP